MDKLCEKLVNQYNEAVDLSSAFKSTTMGIIMSFAFAGCMDTLDAKGFRYPVLVAVENTLSAAWVPKHSPVIR